MYNEQVCFVYSDELNEVLLVGTLMEGQYTGEDMLQGLLLIEFWDDIVTWSKDYRGIVLIYCWWIDAQLYYTSIQVG